MTGLLELAELVAGKKTPWSCRFGFHRTARFEQLITCSRSVCLKCGRVFNESMFGDFMAGREESAAALRALAEGSPK